MRKQIVMIDTKYNKIVYPDNSLNLWCAIQLHNNSTKYYETIRKKVPFILLPDKRVLFNLSKKLVIPPDWFLNQNKTVPYCNVLKKIIEVIWNKNVIEN